ncbi:MAG: hypothetical protein R3B90_06430 [Planctomycetaceae bacterium]
MLRRLAILQLHFSGEHLAADHFAADQYRLIVADLLDFRQTLGRELQRGDDRMLSRSFGDSRGDFGFGGRGGEEGRTAAHSRESQRATTQKAASIQEVQGRLGGVDRHGQCPSLERSNLTVLSRFIGATVGEARSSSVDSADSHNLRRQAPAHFD